MSSPSHSSQEFSALNLDILYHVLGLIKDRRDLSSMMKTCHQYYSSGLPHLFRSGICLRTQAQLESFCNFMLTERPNLLDRFQYFTTIALFVTFDETAEHPQVVAAELLNATLSRAISLQEVIFSTNTENVLRSSPTILSTFSRLPSLRTLHLRGCGSKVIEFLRDTKSPISSLHLTFYNRDAGSYGMDHFVLLKNISTTLTTLNLFNCDPKSMEVQFPLVHTLTIRTVEMASGAAIVYACPNLRNLTLQTLYERWDEQDDNVEIENRNRNRERLLGLRERWEGLHSLAGDPTILFNFGLMCDVQELNFGLMMDPTKVKWSKHLLQDHHPTRLMIELWVAMASPEQHDQILHATLQSSRLTSLILRLHFYECKIDATLENLLTIMQTVSLRHLTLILEYHPRTSQDPGKEMAQKEELKRIDPNALSLKIARTLSSLDCLVLETYKLSQKSYWKLGTHGIGEEVAVERVSPEEGEALVAKATQFKHHMA